MQLALLFLPLLITGTALGEAEWEEDEEYEEEDDSQFAEVIAETDTALIRLSFKQKINLGCHQCMYVCKSLLKHGKSSVKLKLKTKTNYNCFT